MASPGPRNLGHDDQQRRKSCRWGLPDGGEDRISALPDDMLHQILTRLRCARSAAKTSLLARRWRGVWAGLPELVFRSTGPDALDAALALVAHRAPALLDIDVTHHRKLEPARLASLLRAAAALAPAELVVHGYAGFPRNAIDLPRLDRTASIKMDVGCVGFALPPAGGFAALESLHLEDCCIDLTDLLARCPRLRKLWVIGWSSESIAVRSPSLEDLAVHADVGLQRIDVSGPALKKLHLNAYRGIIDDGFSLSYSAPAVEDLSWKRECRATVRRFGVLWRMWTMTLSAKHLQHTQLAETSENTCLMLQGRPLTRVLTLWMEADVLSGDQTRTFGQEISQFLVTNFSVLELDLRSRGHVYGPMILHLLGLYTSIQILSVTLDFHVMCTACLANCRQTSNWSSHTIPLTDLKEVQIRGFGGKDHEIDFLKVLLRSAAMLESVSLRFSGEISPSDNECMEIHKIFEAYPSVECKIYRKSEINFYNYNLGCYLR